MYVGTGTVAVMHSRPVAAPGRVPGASEGGRAAAGEAEPHEAWTVACCM